MRLAWLRAAALAASVTAGCGDGAGTNARTPVSAPGVSSYSKVTGTVQSAPADSGGPTMFVEVDDIPGFVGPNGAATPMVAMTLPFRIDSGLASGLSVGTHIVFDLEIDWDAATPGRIVRILSRQAPAATQAPGAPTTSSSGAASTPSAAPSGSAAANPPAAPSGSGVPPSASAIPAPAPAQSGNTANQETGQPTAPALSPSSLPAQPSATRAASGGVPETLRRFIVDQLGVEPVEVTLEAKWVDDLGVDSLDEVELFIFIEEEYGIEIPDADAKQIVTVGDLVSYLDRRGVSK